AQAPGPRADRAPAFGSLVGILGEFAEDGADAFLPAIAIVRFEVAIIRGGERVTLFENRFDGPAARLVSARRFVGVIIFNDAFDIRNPARSDLHVGFGGDGMVAAEAQTSEGGRWFWRF